MSRLLNKINCPNPNHRDDTPSCAVYEDGHGYCFGCNSYFKQVIEKIEDKGLFCYPKTATEPENIDEKIKYIESLPKQQIRGLELPYDNRGYYIVWPDRSYYKLRLWDNPNTKSRYVSPSGHVYQCLYIEGDDYGPPQPLIFIEGEINALSFNKAFPRITVVSPGSASELGRMAEKGDWRGISAVIIFVDNDPPGVAGALKFKEDLKHYIPDIRIYTLDRDFNSILISEGVNGIKEKIKAMGVQIEVR